MGTETKVDHLGGARGDQVALGEGQLSCEVGFVGAGLLHAPYDVLQDSGDAPPLRPLRSQTRLSPVDAPCVTFPA